MKHATHQRPTCLVHVLEYFSPRVIETPDIRLSAANDLLLEPEKRVAAENTVATIDLDFSREN
jgi:hypothetical protein